MFYMLITMLFGKKALNSLVGKIASLISEIFIFQALICIASSLPTSLYMDVYIDMSYI